MNCDDVTSILNSHETDSLDAPRRVAFDAHLAACLECGGTWRVANVLRRERWPGAPHGLLASIVDGLERPEGIEGIEGIERLDGTDGIDGVPTARTAEARRRAMRWAAPGALLAASVALAVGIGAWRGTNEASPDDVFEAGRQYRLVSNTLSPMAEPAGAVDARSSLAGATPIRVEVLQFFIYRCRPCYAFEPQVDGWETKAEYVELLHVPVVFDAIDELHARAFYTAEALGKVDEMHAEFFAEIHERGNRLDTDESIADLFARFEIAPDEFRRVFGSPEIDGKVEAAIELARSFGVTAAPSLVVGGRYLTSPSMTGSFEDTFAVIDTLASSIYEARQNARCAPAFADDRSRRIEPRRTSRGCARDDVF